MENEQQIYRHDHGDGVVHTHELEPDHTHEHEHTHSHEGDHIHHHDHALEELNDAIDKFI